MVNLKRTILLEAGSAEVHRNLVFVLIFAMLLFTIFLTAGYIFSPSRSKAASMENSYKYYTSIEIQKGDTLWDIAQEYAADFASISDYVEELKELNGLGDDRIHAGQFLTICYYSREVK